MRQQGLESDGSAMQGPQGSEGVTLAPHRHSPRAGAGESEAGCSANLGADSLNTMGLCYWLAPKGSPGAYVTKALPLLFSQIEPSPKDPQT